jgi:hypothetical protein
LVGSVELFEVSLLEFVRALVGMHLAALSPHKAGAVEVRIPRIFQVFFGNGCAVVKDCDTHNELNLSKLM